MTRFYLFGGALLLSISVLQVVVQLRKREMSLGQRLLSRVTMRAVLFATVGVLGLLVGLGVIPLPVPPGR